MPGNRTILDHEENKQGPQPFADQSTQYFTWAAFIYGFLIAFNLRLVYLMDSDVLILLIRLSAGLGILGLASYGLSLGVQSVTRGERNLGRRYLGIVGNLLLIVTILLMLFNLYVGSTLLRLS